MKLLLLCLCVAAATASLAPLHMAKRRGIPNSFIIKAKDASVLDQVEKDVLSQFQSSLLGAPKVSKIRDLLPVLSLRIPPHLINKIRAIDGIEYIEQDALGELFGQQNNPTWGIDRIDSRDGIDNVYKYKNKVQGDGAKIYIVDTGTRSTHNEFAGRVKLLFGAEDDHGHGTHCGGTAAGSTYGIARKAKVYSVKVCDKYGSCAVSKLLKGLNKVSSTGRGVVSMSLGFPITSSIDTAVKNLIADNFVVSVAAGNSNSDACDISPARVPGAITVAASNKKDQKAGFSCWGSCVDLFAPGVEIESASGNTDSGAATMSGTSMACPHVTGAAALYIGKNPNSKTVKKDLIADATPGKISNPNGTPNKLLYTGNL